MKYESATVVIMKPGRDAYTTSIIPSRRNLRQIVGGAYEEYFPRKDGICIICRKVDREQVLRANRMCVTRGINFRQIFLDTIVAIGSDLVTCQYRSLTDSEIITVYKDYGQPHFPDYWWFNLEPGEELLMDQTDAVFETSFKYAPNKITVVKEYPYLIQVRALCQNGELFDFCINKADLIGCKKPDSDIEILHQVQRYSTLEFLGHDKYKTLIEV